MPEPTASETWTMIGDAREDRVCHYCCQAVTSAAVAECSCEVAALQCTHAQYIIAEGKMGQLVAQRQHVIVRYSRKYVMCGYVSDLSRSSGLNH